MRLKARDMRHLAVKELQEKAASLEEELFNLRFQAKMGQLSNALRLRAVRRDIARVNTVINEKRGEQTPSAPKAEVQTKEEQKVKHAQKPEPKPEARSKGKAKPKEKTRAKANTKHKAKASSK